MTSNIINMAERNMDREDKLLTELFAPEPVADNGFSKRVMRRVRRQIWVDRLALPVAAVIGLALAINPLLKLFAIVPSVAAAMPFKLPEFTGAPAVDANMLIVGGVILVAGLFVTQLVED